MATGEGGLTILTPEDVTEYGVESLVPWSETQKGLLVLSETPQGFLRLGSMTWAGTAPSEIRLVWVKAFSSDSLRPRATMPPGLLEPWLRISPWPRKIWPSEMAGPLSPPPVNSWANTFPVLASTA